MDQWSRKESPEIGPHIFDQLIFDKGAKQFNAERIVFSTNGTGTIKYSYPK